MTKIPEATNAIELLDELGYTSPPFDPFKIAESLGIDVDDYVTSETMDRAGSISMDSAGNVSIWINPFDATIRKRFTMAHEIGHFINRDLKPNNPIIDLPETLYRTDGDTSPQEIAANKFATDLLMPKKHIYAEGRKIIDASEGGTMLADAFIGKMAELFDVSKLDMLFRLKEFGIIDSGSDS